MNTDREIEWCPDTRTYRVTPYVPNVRSADTEASFETFALARDYCREQGYTARGVTPWAMSLETKGRTYQGQFVYLYVYYHGVGKGYSFDSEQKALAWLAQPANRKLVEDELIAFERSSAIPKWYLKQHGTACE